MSEFDSRAYDGRRYQLMEKSLDDFERGTLRLIDLIYHLESLLDSLVAANEDWKEEFRQQWDVLELAYAVANARNETVLSPGGQLRITQAVKNIRQLLAPQLLRC